MGKEKIKIKAIGRYNGHSFKPNGAVDLKLKFAFDELPNYFMKLPLLRSENTKIICKIEDGDTISLGVFMFWSFRMDHDGEGEIGFNSQYSSVEPDSLNQLVENKDKLIRFGFIAEIEVEEESEQEK